MAGRYGRRHRATDVLSFSQQEGESAAFSSDALGDVIISIDSAERQAKRRRVDLDSELRDLLTHGILHLLGMDHMNATDRRAMRDLEGHLRWLITDQP